MKVYYVTVELYLGEYEKNVQKFVEAEDESHAAYLALAGESHNDYPSYEDWVDSSDDWWDDYMVYRIYNVWELPDEVAAMVRDHNTYGQFSIF